MASSVSTYKYSNSEIVVWVRIPDLPCELCNDQFLWRVSALVGTMLKVDRNTSIHSNGKFVRICVEIDLQRKLVPAFTVLGAEFKLEYEGLHLICFGCGKYGEKEACPELTVVVSDGHEIAGGVSQSLNKEGNHGGVDSRESSANNQEDLHLNHFNGASIPVDENPCFGSWMLARKYIRKKGSSAKFQGADIISGPCEIKNSEKVVMPKTGGSRFNILLGTNMHESHGNEDVLISRGPTQVHLIMLLNHVQGPILNLRSCSHRLQIKKKPPVNTKAQGRLLLVFKLLPLLLEILLLAPLPRRTVL